MECVPVDIECGFRRLPALTLMTNAKARGLLSTSTSSKGTPCSRRKFRAALESSQPTLVYIRTFGFKDPPLFRAGSSTGTASAPAKVIAHAVPTPSGVCSGVPAKHLRRLRSRNNVGRQSPAGNLASSQDWMMQTDPTNRPSDDYPWDMRVTHRIRAHETRFSSGAERTTREVEGLKGRARIPDSNQFRMP